MTKRKIKSVNATRQQYLIESIHDDEVKIVEFPTSYKAWNEDGELVAESSWDHSGQLSEKFEFEYQEGLKVSEKIYLDETEIAEAYSYEYDDKGKVTKAFVRYLDGHDETCTYAYNEEGKLILKEFVDDEGDEGEKEEFAYADGKLIQYKKHGDFGLEEETHQKWDGDKLVEKDQQLILEEDRIMTKNQYDEQGRLSARSESRAAQKVVFNYTYHYNEDNKLESVKQDEGQVHTTSYSYDAAGNETFMEDRNEDGMLNFKVERNFDEDGNVTEAKVEIYNNEELLESKYTVLYSYTFFE